MKYVAPDLNNPLVNALGKALDGFRLWILNVTKSQNIEIRELTDTGTSNYTILETDCVINVTTAGVTITALSAVDVENQQFTVKNSSGGNITFTADGTETIDGTTSWTIGTLNAMKIMSDGANWIII